VNRGYFTEKHVGAAAMLMPHVTDIQVFIYHEVIQSCPFVLPCFHELLLCRAKYYKRGLQSRKLCI
jgi:hypothetical protein